MVNVRPFMGPPPDGLIEAFSSAKAGLLFALS